MIQPAGVAHHSYAITVRLRYSNDRGMLGRISTAIGDADGLIGAVDIVNSKDEKITRDFTVNATDDNHGAEIVEKLKQVDGVDVVSASDRIILAHLGGKIEVQSKTPVKTRDDLSLVYTPGVAKVCEAIHRNVESSYSLTIRKNMIAVVSDGTAVLGLGDIGPEAAMPVMEGKAMLFKEFGDVDAFPICLRTTDMDEIVETVKRLEPTFGGVNLEDISSPRCIEIEQRLRDELEIPVFHDDQHGTAIVVLAGLTNSLKLLKKTMSKVRIVINGAGAAGVAIAKLLTLAGVKEIIACDRSGAIYSGRTENMNGVKEELASFTNQAKKTGALAEVLQGADVFIGVSAKNVLSVDDVRAMADQPIVFAMANPDPEIAPELISDFVPVVATGRSDYPNQVNNVLCFPGLFRGVLDVRASDINDKMKLAAADAISSIVTDGELCGDYIIPSVFDRRVAKAVSKAVAKAAKESGVARRQPKLFDVGK